MCGHPGLCTLQVQKDEFMGNLWVLALLWCSSVSGEESLLWKGCFVMDHMDILMVWTGKCPGALLDLLDGLSPKRDGRDGFLHGSVCL